MAKRHTLAVIRRFLDVIFSAFGLVLCGPLLAVIYLLLLVDPGSPIYRQQRVGRYGVPFYLYKFRSMRLGTPSTPTHFCDQSSITKLGGLLRRTKLDELPQLWNVLIGDMSLVGPRPSLLCQTGLISLRIEARVLEVRPGMTGLAQLRGVDMSTPNKLVALDSFMVRRLTTKLYLKCLIATVSNLR